MKVLFSTALLLSVILGTPAEAAVKKWTVSPADSSITFSGKQMGTAFSGSFQKFTANISFDAADLAQSSVKADIDLASATSPDKDVASSVKTKDWLDVEKFATAHFESTSFEKNTDGSFKANGNLNLHGVTAPASIAFTLTPKADAGKDGTVMDGTVTLDRSTYKLGTGEWADPSVVANDVVVKIHLQASVTN